MKHKIDKIHYGISVRKSLNITENVHKILKCHSPLILSTLDVNDCFTDPYPLKKKYFIVVTEIITFYFPEKKGRLLTDNEFLTIQLDDIYLDETSMDPVCYFVSNLTSGGAVKYIKDIISHYKCNFAYIKSKANIKQYKFKSNDLILFQHFFFTDLEPEDIINIVEKSKCKLVISIHDFHLLHENIIRDFSNSNVSHHNNYLLSNINIHSGIRRMFDMADVVIHPSYFTYNQFSKYFRTNNFKYIYHNDIKIEPSLSIPFITNKCIKIGMMQDNSEYKGAKLVEILEQHFLNFGEYRIKFYRVGVNVPPYDINDYYAYLDRLNIHCLLYLNRWGETHCYGLSLGLNSGLPILYNNFGAYKERIPKKEHYFKVYEYEDEISNHDLMFQKFEQMLRFIILNAGKRAVMNHCLEIQYNPMYDDLFANYLVTRKRKKLKQTESLTIIKSTATNKTQKCLPTYEITLKNLPLKSLRLSNKDLLNVVIVPSKIKTSSHPLDYVPIRSVYSWDTRYIQTLNSFTSIRRYIPNSFIIFIDNSNFSVIEKQEIDSMVDVFINPIDNLELAAITDYCSNKGKAEINLIMKTQKYIPTRFRCLFKLSGRYQINRNFDYSIYDNDNNVFKLAIPNSVFNYPPKYYFTCFYKISKKYRREYFKALNVLNKIYDCDASLELQLPKVLKYQFKECQTLGVTENISVMNYINDI